MANLNWIWNERLQFWYPEGYELDRYKVFSRGSIIEYYGPNGYGTAPSISAGKRSLELEILNYKPGSK